MSKQRHKQAPVSKPQRPQPTLAQFAKVPPFFRNMVLQSGLIFALAFLLYANTLTHGFVLDDAIVITDNMYTQQGVKGIGGILSKDTFFGFFKVEGKETLVSGGRYRPMTLALFALIYEFSQSPFVFHLFTVLLFAFTCVVLYRVLLVLFVEPGGERPDSAYLTAWLASVLFASHPIHTEVVANIKGCDEILTLLGSLGAMYWTLKFWDSGRWKWSVAAGLSFLVACLSKENAAAFVVLIPLALWIFRGGNSAGKSVLRYSMPILVAFAIFFVLRGSILQWRFGGEPLELMNNPFLKLEGNQWVKFTLSERLATIFYTLWKYVQLLIVPHPLTHDYYPRQVPMMSLGNIWVLLSMVLYGFAGCQAVRGVLRRHPFAFGILLYLLPLGIVSNLVFPIGTNMGERFVFMPSVGFCLLTALLFSYFYAKKGRIALVIFGIVVLLFSLKTVLRNPVWESNEKLFFADAEVSSNSAKLQNACGGVLFDRATKEKDAEKQKEFCRKALPHLNQAIKIYPNYKDAFISRAGAHYVLRQYPEAIADYRRAVELAQDDPKLKLYLAMALRDGGRYYGEQKNDLIAALRCLDESWVFNPADPETARLLGVVNGVQGKHKEAIGWFAKAVEMAPKEASYLWDLGMAYSASGDNATGEQYRQRAITLDPFIIEKRGGRR